MRGSVRDSSWLIGPLLIVPALLYLSFWYFQNGDFLKHARRATARIAPYQWGLPKAERKPQYDVYATYIEFKDESGQRIRGYVFDSPAGTDVGDSIDILYDPRRPDFRWAGGIFRGLFVSLGAAVLGILLGLTAILTTNKPTEQPTPSYLDYWGGDDEYWSVKAEADRPTERDVLD